MQAIRRAAQRDMPDSASLQVFDPTHKEPRMMVREAAWLPDPAGVFALRYWDGHHWTRHVAAARATTAEHDPGTNINDLEPPMPARLPLSTAANHALEAHAARSVRRQRRIGAGALMLVPLLVTVGLVALRQSQADQIGVWARIVHKSCHDSESSDGGTFKACVVDLHYTTPDGTPGTVTFHGVQATRIHTSPSGEEVKIYFAPGSSTAVNPQDRIPSWALVFFAAMVWFAFGLSAWTLLFRTQRARTINRLAEMPDERAAMR